VFNDVTVYAVFVEDDLYPSIGHATGTTVKTSVVKEKNVVASLTGTN